MILILLTLCIYKSSSAEEGWVHNELEEESNFNDFNEEGENNNENEEVNSGAKNRPFKMGC